MASKKFKALAFGVAFTIVWFISYAFIFFLVLPNAGLQFLPILISNTGATWNQFFYDGLVFSTLAVFIWTCLIRVKRAGNG